MGHALFLDGLVQIAANCVVHLSAAPRVDDLPIIARVHAIDDWRRERPLGERERRRRDGAELPRNLYRSID